MRKEALILLMRNISTVTPTLDRSRKTSFIQEAADKHIPLKTSRPLSSIHWITPG